MRRRIHSGHEQRCDFRKLYATESLHPGLVILIPSVDGELQQRLFQGALEQLALIGEPINQVLEVDLEGEDVTIELYEWPSPGSGV